MAMTGSSMALKIFAKLNASNPNMTPENRAIMQASLEAFCEGIIEEIQENGSIVMQSGDFNILPGSFRDGSNSPLTGTGINADFDLQGKIE